MKYYWVVKNKTGEDIPLKIRLWNGQEVEDVFHANEVVVLNNQDSIHHLRRIDPLCEVFSFERREEESQGHNWRVEGF